jgi:hypothetical protein
MLGFKDILLGGLLETIGGLFHVPRDVLAVKVQQAECALDVGVAALGMPNEPGKVLRLVLGNSEAYEAEFLDVIGLPPKIIAVVDESLKKG